MAHWYRYPCDKLRVCQLKRTSPAPDGEGRLREVRLAGASSSTLPQRPGAINCATMAACTSDATLHSCTELRAAAFIWRAEHSTRRLYYRAVGAQYAKMPCSHLQPCILYHMADVGLPYIEGLVADECLIRRVPHLWANRHSSSAHALCDGLTNPAQVKKCMQGASEQVCAMQSRDQFASRPAWSRKLQTRAAPALARHRCGPGWRRSQA